MKIVHYPHPALRHKVKPLLSIDKEVRLVAGQMLELMYAAKGLGLAANQVAYPYQLIVINPTPDDPERKHEMVLINPVILEHRGNIEGEEGCLSFPELFQKVRRFKYVKVQAYNLEGNAVEIVPHSDLCSRLLQHEIDHLAGVLFIDKMGFLARRASRGAIEDLERTYRKAQERGEIPPDREIQKKLAEAEAVVL
jgi:peptide deformylase